ncbi:hypothetical protein RJT34_12624 [Clitoria ternatea]|uniref:Uncharacterized protein n=1 Tax=Clitoria ternatea TaxID=43366 RepID=A0AAN9JM45_CLITE
MSEDTELKKEEDPEEEPIEEPVPVPALALAPAPTQTAAPAPKDVEMVDPTDLPSLPIQLPPSEFLDMVAAFVPPPLIGALAVEPLGMYIPDMLMEDLIPLIAPITSLMDGFLARRQ